MARELGGLDADNIAEAAATVRRLLDAVADKTLTADSGLVARLEGAAEALDALARQHLERPSHR